MRPRFAAALGVGALVLTGAFAVPTIASAQADEPMYCNLATPAVRDVVQDAPAIAAVLNLDPALPDATIEAQRSTIGCGPTPQQTPEQARTAVCDVLVEAKVDQLVTETNNPDAATLLETVRPALPQILGQARLQLKCDAAGGETTVTPTTAPTETTAPETTTPEKDGSVSDGGTTVTPQVPNKPENGVNTGW